MCALTKLELSYIRTVLLQHIRWDQNHTLSFSDSLTVKRLNKFLKNSWMSIFGKQVYSFNAYFFFHLMHIFFIYRDSLSHPKPCGVKTEHLIEFFSVVSHTQICKESVKMSSIIKKVRFTRRVSGIPLPQVGTTIVHLSRCVSWYHM